MNRPTSRAKPSVNLAPNPAPGGASGAASSGPRVSRIRRDPPPIAKPVIEVDPDERDQWAVIVGILAFSLPIFFLPLAFGIYADWSPADYSIAVSAEE